MMIKFKQIMQLLKNSNIALHCRKCLLEKDDLVPFSSFLMEKNTRTIATSTLMTNTVVVIERLNIIEKPR